ncbi:MAG: hypothetical protein V4576_01150 [Patescibacteria group bacterium]
MNTPTLWFKRKIYGWGWRPVTWQGWFTLLVYIVLLLACVSTLNNNSSPREVAVMGLLPLIILTSALIRICYKKGEKPHWQWGRKDDAR